MIAVLNEISNFIIVPQIMGIIGRSYGQMRMIGTAQLQFITLKKATRKSGKARYASSFKELIDHKLLDSYFLTGTRMGHKLEMTNMKRRGGKEGFEATIHPLTPDEGKRALYTDETGKITYTEDGSIPNRKSPEVK